MSNVREELGDGHLSLRNTTRPVIYATQGLVSSGHYLTSMAGMRILMSGGNAFDALAASVFAAAVIEPLANYSLAAEGVFMFYDAGTGKILSLSGQGVAPEKATVEFYTSKGLDMIPTGPGSLAHLAFTVPGIVHSLISLIERYGTKTIGEILGPAIQYADCGIPNYEYMLERLKTPDIKKQFDLYPPGGTNIFYHNNQIPVPGSMLIQKNLATTLKTLVCAETASSGNRLNGLRAARDMFYKGRLAKTIVEESQKVGGILDMDDMASYSSQFEDPIKTTYKGYEIYTHSTWTQGPVLSQALNILEGFDLRSMGHNSTEYIHTVTESLKLVMADREAYYGDPDFETIPIDGLISKKYATERSQLIHQDYAYPRLPSPGDPWPYSSFSMPSNAASVYIPVSYGGSNTEDSGTTHAAVLDRYGNMACATPSGGGFVKSVFLPELGASLSTRIEMFNFLRNHPNELEPGKRPRTTLVNYIVAKNGVPVYTIGCPGGDFQAQANLQLILNIVVFGMDPQEAIEVPRFGTLSVVNSFHPHVYYPARLALEPEFPKETVNALKDLGHEVVETSSCGMGATVAERNSNTGVLAAGGDPRRPCYAIGW